MDFFSHQQKARSNTRKLVVYLLLAILSLLAVTHTIFYFVFGYAQGEYSARHTAYTTYNQVAEPYFGSGIFWFITLAIICIVLISSLYKWLTLRSGGQVIAERLGAVLLHNETSDFYEKRVLNVVQEMAIAAGAPVPPVYVLDEPGINAFAAGYSPADAVIGVTRGTITQLNREQLQGVIAHEFSHIFHGDARINLNLIAILHGILVIGLLGYFALRNARGKQAGAIAGIGLALIILGYGGVFFGNLIKAAISRQREFLADASAVQYTRNPEGIAGALKVIGSTTSHGSVLENSHVDEVSHLLFAEGKHFFAGWWATHPPLDDRIRKIEPNWDGKFIEPKVNADSTTQTEPQERAEKNKKVASVVASAAILGSINQIGTISNEQLGYSQRLLQGMPTDLHEKSQSTAGATDILLSFVLNETASATNEKLDAEAVQVIDSIKQKYTATMQALKSLPENLRLPLVDLCIASLKQGSKEHYQEFIATFEQFIRLDKKVNLTEWCLHRTVKHQLEGFFNGPSKHPQKRPIRDAQDDLSIILSMLLQFDNSGTPQQVIDNINNTYKLQLTYRQADQIGSADFAKAVDNLLSVRPLEKPVAIKACAQAITHDKEVNVKEMEVLRALAATWDCPMPPVVVS